MKYERLVPHPDALLTELSDGTGVLLHLETKFYFTLNATGVFVWKQLSSTSPGNADDAARALTEAFDVETAVAESDVRTLVDELLEERLLRAEA